MTIRFAFLFTAAALGALFTTVHAQQTSEPITVAFSDPSRPGTVKVTTMTGTITVRGAARKDVLITTRGVGAAAKGPAGPGTAKPAPARGGRAGVPADQLPSDVPPGFKRLTQSPGMSVEERNNEISITASGFLRGRVDVELQVPARTNLQLTTVHGASIVEGVEGEIEVTSANGPVTLTNVAGSVVAHSMNGAVTATLARVTADKAMSFSTFNGGVDVTLPAAIKASVKLLSYQGDVYTDFDLQLKPSSAPGVGPKNARSPGSTFRVDINDAINGTINGGGPQIELRTFRGRILLRKGP